jgi:2-desacetyl-2-hydroxyethyl bacteriochlorophyllide A dehydrogenase
MKAVVLAKPGLFRLVDMKSSEIRRPDEALVQVRRVGICGTDLHAFHGDQPFFSYPRILGHELGVEIVDIAKNGSGFKAGDRCAVEPYLNCGSCFACRQGKTNCCVDLKVLGVHVDGGMRETFVVPTSKLHKSESLSFDQLALVEMLGIGLHAVERAAPACTDSLLVVGLGPIGLAVIEFARLAGLEIMVMDVNGARLSYCRGELKLARCIDANHDPLTQIRDLNRGELPSVVFDCTGNSQSMMDAFRYVSHGGRLVFVGLFQGDIIFNDPFFHSREMTLMSSRNSTGHEFRRTLRLMEAGLIDIQRWITHRVSYKDISDQLPQWIQARSEFRKALVEW